MLSDPKDAPMYSLYPKGGNSPLGPPRLPNERDHHADRTSFIKDELRLVERYFDVPGCVK